MEIYLYLQAFDKDLSVFTKNLFLNILRIEKITSEYMLKKKI